MAHGYRLLIVDDASPDGSGTVAERLHDRNPRIAVLHRKKKSGLGPAYAAGFAWALENGAEIICEMDADFSHDPARLPALVAAVEEGADLAIGSRYVPGGSTPDWPWHRRLLSSAGNRYARSMLALPVHDATAGFRAYRASLLRQLHPERCESSGYAFQVEMTVRASQEGATIVEVPIEFRDRRWGTSKMGLGIVVEAMWLVTRWGVARLVRKRGGR